MSKSRTPKSIVPVIDPFTWIPDQQAMDKALGKKPDEKRDRRKGIGGMR